MKKEVIVKVYETPPTHDGDDVHWEVDGKSIGYGYRGKTNGRFHVIRCPRCSRENYALQVAEGSCAWCGFNPN